MPDKKEITALRQLFEQELIKACVYGLQSLTNEPIYLMKYQTFSLVSNSTTTDSEVRFRAIISPCSS